MTGFAVIITALDETWSLRETVNIVVADNAGEIADIIVAIAPHTTADCRAVIDEMEAAHAGLVRRHEQRRLPGVGGANQESVELVACRWVIMMAADLETPPETVKELIARVRAKDDVDVVTTSRWMAGGRFGDYGKVKLLCNWLFQKIFALLYQTRLTDMTFGYRACRTELLRRYRWRETGHAFFMESICTFLRDKQRVAEIPASWRRRREGESHIKLSEYLRYFRVGFSVRFRGTPTGA